MRARQVLSLTAAVVLIGGGAALVAAPAAQAAGPTLYVATTGSDTIGDGNNPCTDQTKPCLTIQHAVDQSAGGDTVQVASGSYPESVQISDSITVVGAGATGSSRTSITGNDGPSIDVNGDVESTLSVTLRDLDVSGNEGNDGIDDYAANLTVIDSVVSQNNGHGIDLQGSNTPTVDLTGLTVSGNAEAGVYLDRESNPDVTISGTTISDNGTNDDAYDYAGVQAYGGTLSVSDSLITGNSWTGIYTEATTTVTDTTVDANYDTGIEVYSADLTVMGSTVSNTKPAQTGQYGSQPDGYGAGVLVAPAATATISESTIFGNTAQGVAVIQSSAQIANSTISGTKQPANEDSQSGGSLQLPYGGVVLFQFAAEQPAVAVSPQQLPAGPSATLVGTIVADNTTLADCSGAVTDGGYNLDSDGSCALTAANHSISKGDAKLGGLADNGGPTKTLLPAKGSDAIDVIPSGSANCSAKGTDQRGDPRLAGPKCDIGAVEVAQPPVVIKPDTLPQAAVGKAYQVTLTATGGLGAPYVWSLASGSSLPAGLTRTGGGVLSGTPSTAGTFTFTVSVDDPTLKTYQLVVVPSPTAPTTSTAPLAATGAKVGSTAALGLGLLGAGLLFLVAGARRRRPGRHAG